MFVAHCCDTLKTVSANNVLFLSSKQIHSLLYISFFLYQYICYQYVFSYRNHDITKPYLHKTLRIIYALYFHIEFRVHQPLELVTIYHSTKVCSLKVNRVRKNIDMNCIFFLHLHVIFISSAYTFIQSDVQVVHSRGSGISSAQLYSSSSYITQSGQSPGTGCTNY